MRDATFTATSGFAISESKSHCESSCDQWSTTSTASSENRVTRSPAQQYRNTNRRSEVPTLRFSSEAKSEGPLTEEEIGLGMVLAVADGPYSGKWGIVAGFTTQDGVSHGRTSGQSGVVTLWIDGNASYESYSLDKLCRTRKLPSELLKKTEIPCFGNGSVEKQMIDDGINCMHSALFGRNGVLEHIRVFFVPEAFVQWQHE